MEGGESGGSGKGREEGGRRRKEDRGSPEAPNTFSLCCLFLGFGMGDFGENIKTRNNDALGNLRHPYSHQ